MGRGTLRYVGFSVSVATFASLLLPWWSIRAASVSIDVYPFGVKAWSVPSYDADWVVDRLLTLDRLLVLVGPLVLVSGVLALAGSLRFPLLLLAPAALNLLAGLLFYQVMRSALGKLALWYGSGTNLIPAPGPWGFVWGIGLCVLAGFASPIPLIRSIFTKRKLSWRINRENEPKHGWGDVLKRSWFTLGVVAALLLIGAAYASLMGITPTDTKIIDLLHEKEGNLLGVVGVVGAGIARDEHNHIIGITVYVEGNMTDLQPIPNTLGEFTVYIKEFTKVSELEKERMIIHNTYYNLLTVTTDEASYQHDDEVTITVKNESNETFTFGTSVYDLYFERWNGSSWEFYTGAIGLEVMTYLHPAETGEIPYTLGGQTDAPFPSGTYRAVSTGWLDSNGQALRVWGYAEFGVD